MNKTILITSIIIAIVIILAVLGFILMQYPMANISNKSPTVTSTPNSVTNTPSTTANQPKTYNIEINGFAFSPSTLTIKKGDSVIWTNQDSVSHTVTSDSGTELDSKLLSKGESYSHTFNTVGTYNYHCTIHPGMKAKIIVE